MRLRSTALDARSPEGVRLWPNDAPGDSDRGPLPSPGIPPFDSFSDPMALHPQEVGGAVHDGASASHGVAMGAVRHGSLLHPGDPRVDPSVFAAFDAGGDAVARIRDLRSALSSRWHSDTPDDRRAVALIGLDTTVEVARVSANLAVVCAQLGWPTLLIDGDLQAPAQDRLFRTTNEAGLSTLLQEAEGRAAVQPTAIERLSLLPAGPPAADGAELIERKPLAEALEGRIGRYRLLLLSLSARGESTRFGAVDTILSGFDGALVLASRNASALRPLQRLTMLLEESGVPLLGTVIVP
nr:hypothetical protein [uncultured Sphingomonas sp.]